MRSIGRASASRFHDEVVQDALLVEFVVVSHAFVLFRRPLPLKLLDVFQIG